MAISTKCARHGGRAFSGRRGSVRRRAARCTRRGVSDIELPPWAVVSDKRRAHIARVTALLDRWAAEMHLGAEEAAAWHDAGRLHDALRDAPEDQLRAIVGEPDLPVGLLHGPAAAQLLADEGETRVTVLDAVRWHTVGLPTWDRVDDDLVVSLRCSSVTERALSTRLSVQSRAESPPPAITRSRPAKEARSRTA